MRTTFFPAPERSARLTTIGVIGFAATLALAAQATIPIPGTPVPFTLQPLVVILAGFWLGPRAGAASMALYLAAGAAGLPVFSPVGVPGVARLFGPTGGYLLAYPLAAFAAGWALPRVGARTYVRRAAAAMLGMLVIFAGGLAQLWILTGSMERAAMLGALPFLPFDGLKALLAAVAVPGGSAGAESDERARD
jgi:biotin transport system substrate-specific component